MEQTNCTRQAGMPDRAAGQPAGLWRRLARLIVLGALAAARWMAGLVLVAVEGAMGFALIMMFYVAVVGRVPEATVRSIHIPERTVPALLRVVLAVLMLPLHYVMEDLLMPVIATLGRPSKVDGKT